jgi:hypothetical protein
MVKIGSYCFIGHGVMFINDKFLNGSNAKCSTRNLPLAPESSISLTPAASISSPINGARRDQGNLKGKKDNRSSQCGDFVFIFEIAANANKSISSL